MTISVSDVGVLLLPFWIPYNLCLSMLLVIVCVYRHRKLSLLSNANFPLQKYQNGNCMFRHRFWVFLAVNKSLSILLQDTSQLQITYIGSKHYALSKGTERHNHCRLSYP